MGGQTASITPAFIALLALFFAGMVFYSVSAIIGARWSRPLASGTIVLAAAVSVVELTRRGVEAHRAPTATLTEFSLIMLLSVALLFLLAERVLGRHGVDLAAAGIVLSLLCVCILTILVSSGISAGRSGSAPIPPILESLWRTIHVASAGPGYGGVILSFVFGLLYLVRARAKPAGDASDNAGMPSLRDRIPDLDSLDRLSYLSVAFAFPFLTVLNVTGAVWAVSSWNRYWGWDPKETMGLVTWLIYALYLHLRLQREWRGTTAAWAAVIGFCAMLFTLLGVSSLTLFQNSLHSYARGG